VLGVALGLGLATPGLAHNVRAAKAAVVVVKLKPLTVKVSGLKASEPIVLRLTGDSTGTAKGTASATGTVTLKLPKATLTTCSSFTLRALGKLILELEGAERPFLHLPVPLCRALAAGLARVMKNPPLTPYAVAGFTNDADLDCREAVADFGYAPRGVRAGLAQCISKGAR